MGTIQPSLPPLTIHIFPDGRMDAKNTACYLGLKEKTLAMMRCLGTGPQFIKRGKFSITKKI